MSLAHYGSLSLRLIFDGAHEMSRSERFFAPNSSLGFLAGVFALIGLSHSGAAQAPVTAQQGLIRTPLGTMDFPPGYQTAMVLAELAPNTCAGRHTHPGIETAYFLEGEEVFKLDGEPERHVKPGDAVQIPANVPHEGCAGAGGVKVLAVYVIEKGKPLASPVP